MRVISILLLWLIGVAWVACGVSIALAALLDRSRRMTRARRILRFLGGCGICLSGLASFGQALASRRTMPFFISSEWPVGCAWGVVRDSAGRYVVPQPYINRVQIYDAQRRYLRGWFLPYPIQLTTLHLLDGDRIEVFARYGERLVYSEDGVLLESGRSSTEYYNAAMQSAHAERVCMPTPLLLWPLTSPLIAVVILLMGVLAVAMAERGLRRREAR